MECYQILVIGFFSFPLAFTVILEGPKTAVYPEGTNVTLQCIASDVRNIVVWEDITENTEIFIDKTKNTQRAKFDNFYISDAKENFSLTIVNAQLSDDGFYSCEEGDDSRNANVTIEAGPDLSVFVNNTLLVPENGITLTQDEEVVVMCKADGAKPAVHLILKFGEKEWIESDNIATSKDGLRFTTEASATYSVSRDDTTVTCKATGLVSIPPSSAEISINVLHKPVCHVELKQNIAKCQCVSNPHESAYRWYVDGTLEGMELLLPLHDYIPANLTCLATNAVGTGALASRYVSSKNVDGSTSTYYVIIVIAALIVCSVIFYCLYKRLKRRSSSHDALDDKPKPEEGESLVNADDKSEYEDALDDEAAPGGKESSVQSDDAEEYEDALNYSIEEETDESTSFNQSKKLDGDNKCNHEDEHREDDKSIPQDEHSDDVTPSNSAGENIGENIQQVTTYDPWGEKKIENEENPQVIEDGNNIEDPLGEKNIENEENPQVIEDGNNIEDPLGEKKIENKENPQVIEDGNNIEEDTESPNSNVPTNAIKQPEPALTLQDESTHDAGNGELETAV